MGYELYHHGILGMKWGIRRYQNKDGSLTPAGRRRKRIRYEEYSDDEKRAYELSRKNPAQLSNKELRELNDRLQLKRNYEGLTKKQKTALAAILGTAAGAVATKYATKYMSQGADALISKMGKINVSNLANLAAVFKKTRWIEVK